MIRIVLAVAAVLTMSACTIPGMGGTQTSTPPATTPATTTATPTATQTAPPTAPPSADAVLACLPRVTHDAQRSGARVLPRGDEIALRCFGDEM